MDNQAAEGILIFMRRAENLKNTLRLAFTSTGKRESAAEHSWRLCLLAMACAGYFPDLNLEKCFKLAILHDLPEAICGDVPAIYQEKHKEKFTMEQDALVDIVQSLPEQLRREMLELWQEYNAATTNEAIFIKALDKLETLMQHNQGKNPPDFNYAFNLTYGVECTSKNEFFALLREIIDNETQSHID